MAEEPPERNMIQDIWTLYCERWRFFLQLAAQHVEISATAVGIAAVIGLVLGICSSEYKKMAPLVLGATNFLYTIPAISLLGFLLPVTGVGDVTAVTALAAYALLPMIRNTYAGLETIDPAVMEAARGMGSTRWQLVRHIKLPLALPVILAGFRTMALMTIALAGVASFIGAGGLGVAIYRGITTNNQAMTVAGSLLIAALALACDAALGSLERCVRKRQGVFL